MSKIIIANWKLNPTTVREAVRLARAEDFSNVVIAPPFPFLAAVGRVVKKASLGAQNVFWKEKGAFTGEISASELKSLGVQYVIIGHSERRRWLGETDEMINKKIRIALGAGLKVVLCVGEDWSVRKKGLNAAKNFVKTQLAKDLKNTNKLMKLKANKLVIAYEPVWSIGTGKSDKPEDIVEMAKFIRNFVNLKFSAKGGSAFGGKIRNLKLLYGGSVTSKNIASFMKHKEINGALVGGASLKPKELKKILYVSFH